ncbi:efflux RND transporter permease subunit [Alkalihalobacillus hwajinpoensis]|uniref:efflux RND transporter permease subunit n=1 Tax=Guptibacillus hwajinpoensis TaxID=208199 RepID=UPI0018845FC1|nr:efflux RND transporter permease subunit [Pseudalkalibacillus hwajinpoensis]MBF0708036.1 efflux RND transporter permease subunit [Pseudalkalibacillus hwajinpoensis]
MRKLIQFSLNNKFAVWLLTIIITAAGLYSGFNMKMETIPNINTPLVSVTTVYPGATPEEVSDKVSEPIENKVESLPGVKVVSSSSFENASNVQIEYNFSKNMDEAEDEVRETIQSLSLPEETQDPDVSRLSFNAFPVMSLSVSEKDRSLTELTQRVEDDVLPAVEGVEGVSSVSIAGQEVEEVSFSFKDEKMEEYGLDEETVKNLIKGSAVNIPLGLYNFDDNQKAVVVDGNVSSLEDLKELEIPVIPSQQGQGAQAGSAPQAPSSTDGAQAPSASAEGASEAQAQPKVPTVQLQDIADIELVGEAESISRTNGQESIGIQVTKSADANTVDVVNGVKDKIASLEDSNSDISIVTIFDQGEPIEESVSTMLNKAIIGAIFAVLIILLFLRNIRSTLISVISIPLSLLIALLVLNQLEITLNIMTLGAMTVAIGRVVDDSIVVIENIYRRMAIEGEELRGKELITEATKEMFLPIMSSTIVTIAVFLPLGLVQGPVGELFLPFALTIVFALLASLLVAITIVPAMAHSLFKKGLVKKSGKPSHKEEGTSRLANGYKKMLNWVLNHKLITFGASVLVLVGSLFLAPIVGVSFLPSDQEKMIVATYNPEPGETSENINDLALEAEDYFLDKEDVDTIQFSVGGENPMNPGASNQVLFFVSYDEETEGFEEERKNVLEDLKQMSEKGEWGYQDVSASGGSNQITLVVNGETMDDLGPVVEDVTAVLEKEKDLTNISSSISESYDQFTIVANQEKLSELGLSAGQIGMELRNTGEAPVLTTIQKDGEEINVVLEVNEKTYKDQEDLEGTTITSPLGVDVPLSEISTIEEGESSNTITRRDGKVYANVTAEVLDDNVGQVSADVQETIDNMDLPDSSEVSLGGVTQDINESFTQLGLAMLAAIAIVYLVLVITFGGGLAPLAILFSLPFTVIGGLVGLLIAGETISISSLIGMLMLIGIVVTNAIVLIDRVIHKEKEGYTTREALLEAGGTRLRPILMTALATIGALAPLAFGLEGGALISKGLGVTVIGGLTSSTLLTLIIVPVVYEFFMKFRRKPKSE